MLFPISICEIQPNALSPKNGSCCHGFDVTARNYVFKMIQSREQGKRKPGRHPYEVRSYHKTETIVSTTEFREKILQGVPGGESLLEQYCLSRKHGAMRTTFE